MGVMRSPGILDRDSALTLLPAAIIGRPLLKMNQEKRRTASRTGGTQGIGSMSRRCELTGKGVQVGHKVSHANNKTKRRFLPNLLNVTLISDALGRTVSLRISAYALRSVEHRGGLDAFLVKAAEDDLSPRARLLKRQIGQRLADAS